MQKKKANKAGISAMSYYLPSKTKTVDDLYKAKLLDSSPKELKEFGFNKIHLANGKSAYDLVKEAVRKLFESSNIAPEDISVILYASALPDKTFLGGSIKKPTSYFKYPATLLQYEFGMNHASTIGISQAGCVSMMGAIGLAKNIIESEKSVNKVLCVSSDILPSKSKREILYNLISDGACTAVIERNSKSNKIVYRKEITKGFYWDSQDKENEIIAAYFPTARALIRQTLEEAGLTIKDIKLIVPHNVSKRSWTILSSLIDVPESKVYLKNISKNGHTIAADNIINLHDVIKYKRIKKGDYILLFTFGFGAHWSCMILEH